MPAIDEEVEDLQEDQETLEEIEQAREGHVAIQASEVITETITAWDQLEQFQDAAADDKIFIKIKKN